ncbi:anti-sigma-28 factor, FlgM family [Syntrophus gentianae]|uniref:Negative regulator of flagellin synthesis n=1 Tax=Syntrophus gentianae TaxID=43775 RepID=A0A1H7XRU5_9BACT|nr:flagellar biosynthesis anti-sigma factor FlgM [Syntrophus gentianae]SEM35699.1 anti-sigma-28 factor, FlgM family [Syntrophus gentianae]
MNINNSNGISSKDIQQYMMNESLGKGKDVKEDKSAVIPQEKVDISNKAREIQQINSAMSEIPDVRDEKVSSIKAQIENGTYNVSGEELANKMVGEAFLDIFA